MRGSPRLALVVLAAWLAGAAPALAAGTAWIETRPPGAAMLLDGRVAGQTPYRRALPAGLYNVSVSASGYQARAFRMRVHEGRTQRHVLRLEAVGRAGTAAPGRRTLARQRGRWSGPAARRAALRRAAEVRRARALAAAPVVPRRVVPGGLSRAAAPAPKPAAGSPVASGAARAGGLLHLPPAWPPAPGTAWRFEPGSERGMGAPSTPDPRGLGWGLIALGMLGLAALSLPTRARKRALRRPAVGLRATADADPLVLAGLRLGCWEAAGQMLEEALRAGPLTGWQAYHLGLIRHRQQRFAEAEGAYRAALALDPGAADAAFNLALTLESLGDRPHAVLAYRRLLARWPRHEAGWVNLALLYETLGMEEAAAGAWAEAWKATPRDVAISSAAASASARLHASRSFARISFKRNTASSLGLGTGTTSSDGTWG